MLEIASQMVLCLVIVAIIGILIGFYIGKGFSSDKSYGYNSVSAHGGAASGNIYNKPLIRSAPRPKGKDNLSQIEGIDAILEEKLNHLGIFHFDQIAKWSSKNCHWVEEYLTLEDNQIKEQNWIEQARSYTNII